MQSRQYENQILEELVIKINTLLDEEKKHYVEELLNRSNLATINKINNIQAYLTYHRILEENYHFEPTDLLSLLKYKSISRGFKLLAMDADKVLKNKFGMSTDDILSFITKDCAYKKIEFLIQNIAWLVELEKQNQFSFVRFKDSSNEVRKSIIKFLIKLQSPKKTNKRKQLESNENTTFSQSNTFQENKEINEQQTLQNKELIIHLAQMSASRKRADRKMAIENLQELQASESAPQQLNSEIKPAEPNVDSVNENSKRLEKCIEELKQENSLLQAKIAALIQINDLLSSYLLRHFAPLITNHPSTFFSDRSPFKYHLTITPLFLCLHLKKMLTLNRFTLICK